MSSDLEIAAFIGLDWADQQHVIRLRVASSTAIEAQILDQKPETLQAWIGQLRQRFGGRPVAIALEQSRGSLLYAECRLPAVVSSQSPEPSPVSQSLLSQWR
jgi:hypothetical protein